MQNMTEPAIMKRVHLYYLYFRTLQQLAIGLSREKKYFNV